MIREGVMGVEFIAANTDAQALARSVAHKQVRLGKTASAPAPSPKPGVARRCEERRASRPNRCAGAHMCFITAGMGGGTGTGAAPVVAEVAQEMGILTVAVVTKPFGFEGKRREDR